MEKRAWTARGTMQEADKAVISALTDKNKVAARIFVTGEVHESYIGDAAVRLLVNINDTLTKDNVSCEPLFVETRNNTVRMTRFDPNVVWRCFDPDTLTGLVMDEANRLSVKMNPWAMDHFDFYESMITAIESNNNEFMVPKVKVGYDLDWYYNSVYLTCLLLFHKPGYMDIPVAQHFASPVTAEQLKWVEYRPLKLNEEEQVSQLREQFGKIQGLTNQELNFIISLFKKE